MEQTLLNRLRWGNIARAAAVLVIVAAIVAWPRLDPAAPALPDGAPIPIAEAATAEPPSQPAAHDEFAIEPAPRSGRRQRARARRGHSARRRPERRRRSTPRARAVRPATTGRAMPTPPQSSEFGPE